MEIHKPIDNYYRQFYRTPEQREAENAESLRAQTEAYNRPEAVRQREQNNEDHEITIEANKLDGRVAEIDRKLDQAVGTSARARQKKDELMRAAFRSRLHGISHEMPASQRRDALSHNETVIVEAEAKLPDWMAEIGSIVKDDARQAAEVSRAREQVQVQALAQGMNARQVIQYLTNERHLRLRARRGRIEIADIAAMDFKVRALLSHHYDDVLQILKGRDNWGVVEPIEPIKATE